MRAYIQLQTNNFVQTCSVDVLQDSIKWAKYIWCTTPKNNQANCTYKTTEQLRLGLRLVVNIYAKIIKDIAVKYQWCMTSFKLKRFHMHIWKKNHIRPRGGGGGAKNKVEDTIPQLWRAHWEHHEYAIFFCTLARTTATKWWNHIVSSVHGCPIRAKIGLNCLSSAIVSYFIVESILSRDWDTIRGRCLHIPLSAMTSIHYPILQQSKRRKAM